MSINLKLESLYLEDKEDRNKFERGIISEEILSKNDIKRLKKLKDLLGSSKIDLEEIWNLHYCALLLHHSDNIEDVKKAHNLAKKAVEMGSQVTKWLYVATLDRSLVMQGKKQKFGTQFQIVNGKKVFAPTDGTISKEKKMEFGVLTGYDF